VLDNTGSMANDGKMDALKTASHNLLSQLQAPATHPEDVYVSVVPFSKDVNFGSDNYAASWLRWDLWDPVNGTCSNNITCVSHGKIWTPAPHSTWNGCVTDRDQNYDTKNDAPVAGATLYPAEQYSSCSASLMGLSNDWTKLNSKIDGMTPVGNTNQAIGLQVGWQTLTASPFTVPAVDPDYKYQTVIILLQPAAGRREHCGRRLRLDHSVREGRKSRRCKLEFDLDLLGRQHSRSDRIRQDLLGGAPRRLHQQHHI